MGAFGVLPPPNADECGGCGAAISKGVAKCPSCGVPLDPEVATCSHCGAMVGLSAAACPGCGATLHGHIDAAGISIVNHRVRTPLPPQPLDAAGAQGALAPAAPLKTARQVYGPIETPPPAGPRCPNCGGIWIGKRNTEHVCRVCGTTW